MPWPLLGHLYERLMKVMIHTVTNYTKTRPNVSLPLPQYTRMSLSTELVRWLVCLLMG